MEIFFSKLLVLKEHSFMGIESWRIMLSLLTTIIIILLSGYLSRLITGLIGKLLVKADSSLIKEFTKSLSTCFRVFFLVAAFWVGFTILGVNSATLFVNKLARIFSIYIAAWAIYRGVDVLSFFFKNFVEKTETHLDDYLARFIGQVLKFVVIAVAIVMLINELGYDVTTIVASLGVGGLAIALAGKDFVANVFGFFTIFMDRSFVVGDWISTPDLDGAVEELGMRSTKVRTLGNSLVTIPNSVLANKKIDNFSRMEKRRMSFTVGVNYSSKAEQLESLCFNIREMLEENAHVNTDSIYVYLTNFGESSIDISISFYTVNAVYREYMELQHSLKLDIMKLVEKLDMSLAFPSRSIYFENLDTQAVKLMEEMKEKKVLKNINK